jgi:hypothetical protein
MCELLVDRLVMVKLHGTSCDVRNMAKMSTHEKRVC